MMLRDTVKSWNDSQSDLCSSDQEEEEEMIFGENEDDLEEMMDLSDLPTSLFACSVHEAVFEVQEQKERNTNYMQGRSRHPAWWCMSARVKPRRKRKQKAPSRKSPRPGAPILPAQPRHGMSPRPSSAPCETLCWGRQLPSQATFVGSWASAAAAVAAAAGLGRAVRSQALCMQTG
ncbi:calcipressin-3 isoform X5 [Ochotona curzoniae]|uniref:calcipressin-3 isoform X5 n=1 Tax=Ochotona curzoniae TaxID=130825 RepID=UPI001B3484A8|nr:calcipressin-3 isoform X5 [Ochotona curzoniae]